MFLSRILSSLSQSFVRQSTTAAEFTARRIRLVEKIRDSVGSIFKDKTLIVLVRSAKRQFYAPDVPYPFRQNSYFRYLTGSLQPDAVLKVIANPGGRCKSIMYIKERTEKDELWDGPGERAERIASKSGIDDVQKSDLLASSLDMEVRTCLMSFDPSQFTEKDELSDVLSGSSYVEALREHIDEIRWIKSPFEQEQMRQTCRIGAQSMNAMICKSYGITNERMILGRLELEMLRRGADFLAYPPVIAGAERANIIHYLDANRPLKSGDLVLVDAGCEANGYVSDITRVFPVSGYYSNVQRSLLDALNATHSRLLEIARTFRPLRLNELYNDMMIILSRNLHELGLFTRDLGTVELFYAVDQLCPHHVSHYLGMDVHDTASIPRNIPMKPGVVFTIEPGIYIQKGNSLVRPEFHGMGFRVEDDILMTENGIEVLTQMALRHSSEIEDLMKT